MTEWVGFTDADLQKLKGDTKSDLDTSRSGHRGQRGKASRRGKPSGVRRNDPSRQSPQVEPVTSSQLLSQKKQPVIREIKSNQEDANSVSMSANSGKCCDTGPGGGQIPRNNSNAEETKDEETKKEELTDNVKLKEIKESEAMSREMTHLDKFQQQQKIIERQNKMKRELLSDAIQKRQKAAKQESVKLLQIQRELNKLDVMLNADVSIIRDKIEDSSRDFLEAQKRYERAEKEFVAAKMDLHDKEALKEQFTEHLYTIIHENELRKAHRLADLMREVGMSSLQDENSDTASISVPHFNLLSSVLPSVVSTTQPQTQNDPSHHQNNTSHVPNNETTAVQTVISDEKQDKVKSVEKETKSNEELSTVSVPEVNSELDVASSSSNQVTVSETESVSESHTEQNKDISPEQSQ